MSNYASRKRPAQFRLPEWAHSYVEERAASTGSTKTEVVLEALECLQRSEVDELMAEGYLARAAQAGALSESGFAVAAESWPEW
jgi:hypothetical protein